MNIPDQLFYTSDHEWVKIDNDIATVGITDYAQNELGDIIFIEFPDIGSEWKVGDIIATIEAVKTVADIYSPIAGRVSDINTHLNDRAEFINKDPYGAGWIIKFDLINKENSSLLQPHEYQQLI